MARHPDKDRHLQHTTGLTEAGWHYPEIEKFGEYHKGDSIIWKDDQTAKTFSAPAFGYGPGPFVLLTIRQDGSGALFEIITQQNKRALLSSQHFKKN